MFQWQWSSVQTEGLISPMGTQKKNLTEGLTLSHFIWAGTLSEYGYGFLGRTQDKPWYVQLKPRQ